MESFLKISELNDFIFCPISIYFHNIYSGNRDESEYTSSPQKKGKNSHSAIDNNTYSKRKNILTALDVFSNEFNLSGKIDILDTDKKELVERKYKVKEIYDGYIFQLYGQYYALKEMGYDIKSIKIYSMSDNKNYLIKLPLEDLEMDFKFRKLIKDIQLFDLNNYEQTNEKKCKNCIYYLLCDRSLYAGEE